jgi:hypothetical protein
LEWSWAGVKHRSGEEALAELLAQPLRCLASPRVQAQNGFGIAAGKRKLDVAE